MTDPASYFSAFVSYASPDREKAFEIADSLEARGLKCWIAPRNVRPGREYGDEIIRGIENSRCLILVLSEAANESIYVRREAERAVSKRKPIFPIRIEDVLPSPGLELFVSATHWIDAWSANRVAAFDQIADLLAGASGDGPQAIARKEAIARNVRAPAYGHRAPRRYSPWVLGAAALGAVAVAVIATRLLLFDDGSTTVAVAPPDTAGGHDHSDVQTYSEGDYLQQAIAYSGVDFDALKPDAFDVSARVRGSASQPTVHVKAQDKLATLLPLGKLYYGLNGQAPDTASLTPTINLSPLGPSALDVTDVAIEYRFPDGRKIGPFSYGIDVPGAVRAFYKGKAEQAQSWVSCQDLTCSLEPLRTFLPAVTAVELTDASAADASATDANALEPTIVEVPETPDKDILKGRFKTPDPVLMPGTKETSVVLRYYDGTSSAPRPADIKKSWRNTVLTKLTPVDGGDDPAVPDVYATVESQPAKVRWSFIVDPPKPYEEVYYTLDDGGFFRAKGSYTYSSNPMAYDFDSPADSDVLRLKFRAPDGKELGPFAYKIDGAAMVNAAFRGGFESKADSLIACRYFKKLGDGFNDSLEATSIENTEWWFTNREPKSGTACLAERNAGWVTVKEVHLGTAPERLDVVSPVLVGPDDIVSGKWDGYRRGRGGKTPFSVWHGVVPGKHEDIYARYVFRDETQSDVIRIRTKE